ncbi:MAG: uracil-DNA glycosylase family protein [Acetobacteraceae bacterium]
MAGGGIARRFANAMTVIEKTKGERDGDQASRSRAKPGWKATLERVAAEARACRVCAESLPLGPRPVFQVSTTARLLIASQAPGTKVHESGMPFTDPSGERLRAWLGMSKDVFYDARRVAILPIGLCYPGRLPNGGDAPPRPECAPLWRQRFLDAMPTIRLTLLIGSYAQAWTLGPGAVAERVRNFRSYLPRYFPLPHPSWRSTIWERRNPWFMVEVVPALRHEVRAVIGPYDTSSAS